MKRLWAPWRTEYIHGPKSRECIFCREYGKGDKKDLILHRGNFASVMMNKFPYNNGHLLVYPWKHTGLMEEMGADETLEVFRFIKESVSILKKEMNPGGFNIGMNLGKAAGAGIDEHIHFHVVPRWNGDTNFMPVIGEVRVMPEHLQATYEKLYPHFQKLNTA
ncbi:MAG: HIT domain-containing protein [Deltaproteobacteria bacterium]|nr:HIT domain-containing protein [Deltaproteobacteria bacterium]